MSEQEQDKLRDLDVSSEEGEDIKGGGDAGPSPSEKDGKPSTTPPGLIPSPPR